MSTYPEGRSKQGHEKTLLTEAVQTLSQMTDDLERQVENLLESNLALKSDLEKEKEINFDIARERDDLKGLVAQGERETTKINRLQAEVTHLLTERSRQDAMVEECGRQLADSTQQIVGLERLIERTRAERDDAFEEIQSVEEQFERAMIAAEDLKARLTNMAVEREELLCLSRNVQCQLKITDNQRNELRNEVE